MREIGKGGVFAGRHGIMTVLGHCYDTVDIRSVTGSIPVRPTAPSSSGYAVGIAAPSFRDDRCKPKRDKALRRVQS